MPSSAASPEAAPPTAAEGRYVCGKLIGMGGAGRVYDALDTTLGRRVALKIFPADDSEFTQRLLVEARAQARVDHPNVCKVFDAGRDELGRPYIAMQLVKGPTLDKQAKGMTLEQQLQVVAAVADGVHAAHRIGLVHRDLKPANVLVERSEDGVFTPYVVDFGIARDLQAPGLTATGITMGTPSYMSPEQVQADASLDRRTDVWALGATLYELLTGDPPFVGKSSVEIMMRILNDEVVPPRRRNAGVPADVETIVMTCLERDRARRYDSARALADDLRRFLDGDPVAARPVGLAMRVVRKVKKNRRLAAVAGAGLLAAALLGALLVDARLTSAARARAAQRFGQDVKEIEAILRYAALLPAHDVRTEKRLVRQRMARIESEMRELGPAALGPGSYALGRGHLGLGELAEARRRLELALAVDPGLSEASDALGLTLGMLYHRERSALEASHPPEARKELLRQLDENLRRPAVAHLNAGGKASLSSALYGEMLLALYENRWDEAIRKGAEAKKALPWLYEAALLQGEAEAARAQALESRGALEEAGAAFARAVDAYREGLRAGQSDAGGYESLCGVFLQRMRLDLFHSAKELGPDYREAVSACGTSSAIDPERGGPLVGAATAHTLMARELLSSGRDPLPLLAQARALAERAAARDPRDASAFGAIGYAARHEANWIASQGGDAREAFGRSVEAWRKASALSPSSLAAVQLGATLSLESSWRAHEGEDPRPLLRESIRVMEEAARLDPGSAWAFSSLSVSQVALAQEEGARGEVPARPLHEAAVGSTRKALEINPRHVFALGNHAEALLSLARHEMRRGAPWRPLLAEASDAAERARGATPSSAVAHHRVALVSAVRGEGELSEGRDPSSDDAAAIRAIERAIAMDPSELIYRIDLLAVLQNQARWAARRTADARPLLARGRSAYRDGLRIDARSARLHSAMASLLLAVAGTRVGSREPLLAEAEAVARKALALAPASPEARRCLAEAELQRKELQRKTLRRPAAARDEEQAGNAAR